MSRYTRRQLADAEWRHERATAETVPCRDCRAPAGQTCVNLADRLPLVKQTAHRSRVDDALKLQRPARPGPPAPRLPQPPALKTRQETQ